jgi:hydrogenase-4 component C
MMTAEMIFIGILQAVLILFGAPLFSGFSRVLRAKMHNRRGPGVFQNYRDIAKLMKRQMVISEQTSWIFGFTPYFTMAAMLFLAMIIPMLVTRSPLGTIGDLIFVVYFLALSRFFFSLSGMDSGSTFGGIGGRREVLLSVLIEPVLMLSLFVMALLAKSTNLGVISTQIATGRIIYNPSVWLGMLAFAFATFAEMGKLPFDVAEAEQELQEGPLAEYSGHSLAIMKWGLYMKQMTLVALFLAIFFPYGSMSSLSFSGLASVLLIFLLKITVIYLLVAVFENAMARVRFMKASAVTWTALGAGILSFVFYLANV